MIIIPIFGYFYQNKTNNMENKFLEKALEVVSYFNKSGKAHLNTTDQPFTGKRIEIENQGSFLNFSLCDYLTLSTDERVKEESAAAVLKYGTYTAISRTFLKLKIYQEAEDIVSKIFDNKPVLLLPRTTLSHIAVLPIVIGRKDAVILDHQVHTTVRLASDMINSYGIHIETIRHNNLEALEKKYKELESQYDKIWYFTDGVYSMFGDTIPILELESLLNKHEKLHLYVDDAHGMSWSGNHGQGYVLSKIKYHPKLFLVTSLGKGFGAGGSAVVCPNEEVYDRILNLGAPLMFTSPVEPATLGAIISSAKIHLSQEITQKQDKLKELMDYFYSRAKTLNIPIVDYTQTPIALVATGTPELANEIADALFQNKIHVTGAIYPAVPYHNSGVRVMITLYQTMEDIDFILDVIEDAFKKASKKFNLSNEQILKHFKKG